MRITHSEIRRMVEDELRKQSKNREEEEKELDEVNPNHDPKTGKFQKKEKPGVYSLTSNAKDNVAADTELEVPARGNHSGNNKNIRAKYGMNTSKTKGCGRLDLDGNKKPKYRRCHDYPKPYAEEYIRSSPESDYIKKKKKETERKNKNKNRKDLVPRDVDSPSIRREKVFGGSKDLFRLARGIAEEQAENELPRWDIHTGKLATNELEQRERNVEVDDTYLKGLIKQAVLSGLEQARAEAAKSGRKYSWNEIMALIASLETAQKGNPKPK